MLLSVILLVVSMVSIQSGASFAKSIFHLAGPLGTSALRVLFASFILVALWRPWRFKLSKKALSILIPYGLCLGLMNATFYLALKRVPLGIVVTLEFIGPLSYTLYSSRRTGKNEDPKLDLLWAFFAAVGVYLIVPKPNASSSSLDVWGVILSILAGALWAGYIHFGQKASRTLHAGMATSIGMAIAAAITLPLGFIFEGGKLLNPAVWPFALLVAILSSALPYSLEMIALKKIPAKTFGILMSLEPAFASCAGFVILKEKLTLTQWVAMGFIVVASFGSVTTATKKKKIEPETLHTP